MSDEYDVFAEAEIEDRLLAREDARKRLVEAINLEVGTRAAVRLQTEVRDDRYFKGLFGMRIG